MSCTYDVVITMRSHAHGIHFCTWTYHPSMVSALYKSNWNFKTFLLVIFYWTVTAYEWMDHTHKSRPIDIQFDMTQCHLVVSANRRQLRVIDFSRQEGVALWVANDNRKNTVLIHIPKEFDLVRYLMLILWSILNVNIQVCNVFILTI